MAVSVGGVLRRCLFALGANLGRDGANVETGVSAGNAFIVSVYAI